MDPKKKAQKKKDFFGGKRFELRRKRKKIPAKYKIDIQQVKPKKKNFQKKKKIKTSRLWRPWRRESFFFSFFLKFFLCFVPIWPRWNFSNPDDYFFMGVYWVSFSRYRVFFFCSMDPTIDPLDIQRKTLEHGLPTDFGKKK